MKRLLLLFLLGIPCISHSQITLDYTSQLSAFNANRTVNTNGSYFAGGYDNGSTELGTYANGSGGGYVGDPGVALFRTFTTAAGGNSGTPRPMQVGDEFSITCYVGNSAAFFNNSNAGISFNGGTSNSAFGNFNTLQRAKFQINKSDGNLNGNWFGAGVTPGLGFGVPGGDITFKIKLTSAKTANLTISGSNGAVTYDMVLANSPGASANIQSYVIWNQSSGTNNNMFWKNASLKTTGTVEIGTGNGTLTFDGAITDGANPNSTTITVTNDVTKSGTGTITFSAANSYTGTTRITGGSIKLDGAGTVGVGSNVYISNSASLNLNGVNATVSSVQETSTGNGGTVALGSGTLTVSGSWSGTKFQNSISGTGGIVKQGAGILSLYGTQGYTGSTTISGGELSTAVVMASASYTINGGTFSINGANIIPDGAAITMSSGSLAVNFDETINNLTLTGGAVIIAAGKTLTINGSLSLPAGSLITLGAGAAIKYGSTGALIYNSAGALSTTAVEWPSTDAPHSVVINSGTLTLGGNRVTGDVAINGGSLDLGSYSLDRALAGGTFTVANGAILKIGGNGTFPANYTTHIIGDTSVIEYNGANQVVATLNSAQAYGTLTISGTGTKTLSGNTSATAVNIVSSTLDIAANSLDRATSGGSFTIAGGATLKIGGTKTFPANYAAHTLGAASLTEYYGATQQVAVLSQPYGHVIISGTGAKTFAGDVTAAGNLTLNAVALTATSGQNLTVGGNVVNNGGTLTLENNANLLQGTATTVNANSGSILVHRDSSPLYRNDFIFWSSPVGTQNLFGFSPNTVAGRFYTYNTATNQFNAVPGLGTASTTTFMPGKGYMIRLPDTALDANGNPTGTTSGAYAYQNGSAAMTFNGVFNGVPNNGNVTIALATAADGYNLVGNPYPSPINIPAFFLGNNTSVAGTMWIWRKKNGAASTAYVTVNSVGIYAGNGQPEQEDPGSVLRTGQGFIVKLKPGYTSTDVVFTNSMRVGNTTNQFFRNSAEEPGAAVESHGIWLNLTSAAGAYSQMYAGYIAGATAGEDDGIDARYINDVPVVLSSLINTKEYTIQGRALPFTPQDIVPLQLRTNDAGTYSITIDHVNGLFANGQDIYLRDNFAGTLHSLTQGAYTFSTQAGTFSSRFEIVFTNAALGTGTIEAAGNNLMVYPSGNELAVTAANEILAVTVHDARGRVLFAYNGVNARSAAIKLLPQQQVLVVTVTTGKGTVNKRIIY